MATIPWRIEARRRRQTAFESHRRRSTDALTDFILESLFVEPMDRNIVVARRMETLRARQRSSHTLGKEAILGPFVAGDWIQDADAPSQDWVEQVRF